MNTAWTKIRKTSRVLMASLFQKRYKHVTYYFRSYPGSDVLLINFSAFPGKNRHARYNYLDTVWNFSVNQLFLLDDAGYNKTGTYFLGEKGNYYFLEEIPELIDMFKSKYGIEKVIMFGSSKGGSAALLYGIKCHAKYVISGAPQYYWGKYLQSEPAFLPILAGICEEITPKSIASLDDMLGSTIRQHVNVNNKPIIYLHYSPSEHTFQEHIFDLERELQINSYPLILDNQYGYTEHSDVGIYFKTYLKTLCSDIIQ